MSNVRISNGSPTLERMEARQSEYPKPSACRNLFGPVNHEELNRDLKKHRKEMEEACQRKWNFDFQNHKPLEGRYEWQAVEKGSSPDFYFRPPRLPKAVCKSAGRQSLDQSHLYLSTSTAKESLQAGGARFWVHNVKCLLAMKKISEFPYEDHIQNCSSDPGELALGNMMKTQKDVVQTSIDSSRLSLGGNVKLDVPLICPKHNRCENFALLTILKFLRDGDSLVPDHSDGALNISFKEPLHTDFPVYSVCKEGKQSYADPLLSLAASLLWYTLLYWIRPMSCLWNAGLRPFCRYRVRCSEWPQSVRLYDGPFQKLMSPSQSQEQLGKKGKEREKECHYWEELRHYGDGDLDSKTSCKVFKVRAVFSKRQKEIGCEKHLRKEEKMVAEGNIWRTTGEEGSQGQHGGQRMMEQGITQLWMKSKPQSEPPHGLPLLTNFKSSFCKKIPAYEADSTSWSGSSQKTNSMSNDDLGQVT
ncbi:hypothetical protein ASZ78_016623 [Callipepla squamata]|uniref:Cyclin-dependent kinase inhibitor 1B n=4 Tax=Aves TaxID=8782 RepID=A0A226NE06_CALSU|nr:hypothetical protein ASZ78_016623 [Callipepla squamata]